MLTEMMGELITAILLVLGGACVSAEFQTQWSKTGLSEGHAVVYHAQWRSVFSLGSTRTSGVSTNDSDASCACFNADSGDIVWKKQLHVGNRARANAAVAGSFGLFVAGTAETGTTLSGSFVAKLNHTDGSILWNIQKGGQGSGSRNRNAEALSLSNNGTLVYVTGSICNSGVRLGSDKCYVYVETLRASDGASLRIIEFGPGKSDEGRSIGVDADGNILVAGRTKGTFANRHKDATATENGRYDYFLVKMDAAKGTIQWSQQGKGAEDDSANSLSVHSDRVYVAGVSYYSTLPFAFWASFDLSNGDRKDNYNGLAGEAHSVLTVQGLQGTDGPFITGQHGTKLFLHKYQLAKRTVAKHALTPATGKTLAGGQAALITESVGGMVTAKGLVVGGTQTTISNTLDKSYVLYRLELINNCTSGVCGQNGECLDLIDDFACRCHEGYEGDRCQNEIDECQSNPCQNMGSCLDEAASYSCVCVPGYAGVHCELNTDDCDPNPCVHGSCNDLVGDFHCICDSGWEGKTCEQSTDDCKGVSCGPGVCQDMHEAYNCVCPVGYVGQNCQINIDDCASSPCINGGTCVDYVNRYECTCPSGTSQPNCADDVDECSPPPCLNGGRCVEGVGTFTCFCPTGYVGKRCEATVDYCASNPCQNGGQCAVLQSGFYCNCPDGFEGKRCESSLALCNSSPCQNGGTCVAKEESFACVCTEPYLGHICNEINVTLLANTDVTTANAEDVAESFRRVTEDPGSLRSDDISHLADLTKKLLGFGELSETAINYAFDAIDSIVGVPKEVLDEAHGMSNSSAKLSHSLETFGEHVLRHGMPRAQISKENLAVNAEVFDNEPSVVARHLIYQVITRRRPAIGQDSQSEDLVVSSIPSIEDAVTNSEQYPNAVLQLPTSMLSHSDQNKPLVLNTVALKDASLFPGILPVGTVVNSQVLSVRLNSSRTHHLTDPVLFSLKHSDMSGNMTRARCVWWDYKALNNKGNWSDIGCTTLASILSKAGLRFTNCSCNHLTNFAVLVDLDSGLGEHESVGKQHETVLHYITLIFGPLSMISLGITIFLILVIKILRENQAMQILLNLCIALLLTMLFFVVGIEGSKYGKWCRAAAILIHYFALASVMWMLMEGFNFYLHLVRVFGRRSSKIVLKYSIVGWGVPFLIVLAAIIADVQTDGGVYIRDDICWISSTGWFFGSFIAPICIVLLTNFVFFILVAKAIKFAQSGVQEKNAWIRKLKISVAVAAMLGLTWIFLAFTWGDQRLIFNYLFVIFSTLQGFFIFLFNVLLNREVHNLIRTARRRGVRHAMGASKKQMEEVQSMGSACDSISTSGQYLFNSSPSPEKTSFWSRLFSRSKPSQESEFTLSTMSTSLASSSMQNSRKNSIKSLGHIVPKRREVKTVMKDKHEVCRPAANEALENGVPPAPTDAFADLPYARVNTTFYDKPGGHGVV